MGTIAQSTRPYSQFFCIAAAGVIVVENRSIATSEVDNPMMKMFWVVRTCLGLKTMVVSTAVFPSKPKTIRIPYKRQKMT